MPIKGEILFKDDKGTELEGPRENHSCLVYSFSSGMDTPNRDGRLSGSSIFQEVSVTKYIDKISPILYQALCDGKKFEEITITLFKIGPEGGEQPYFQYVLTTAYLDSIQYGFSAAFNSRNNDVEHIEALSLAFGKIEWKYLEGGVTGEAYADFAIKAS